MSLHKLSLDKGAGANGHQVGNMQLYDSLLPGKAGRELCFRLGQRGEGNFDKRLGKSAEVKWPERVHYQKSVTW